jgi:hypothetical protein
MNIAIPRPLHPVVTVTAMLWLPMLMSARMIPGYTGEAGASEAARRILSQQYGLSEDDVSKIERGKMIVEILDTQNDHEVSILSIVKVSASRGHLLGYARELQRFANTGFVTRLGRLAPTDLATDMEAIEVRREDLKAVRSCTLGDCDLKLPEPTIQLITALDRDDQFASDASGIVLGWLRNYLVRYDRSGNPALVVYADRQQPQPLVAALEALLASAPAMDAAAPELYRFLATGGADNLSGLEESYYWSVEEFGMRPLTTVTQQVVYLPEAPSPTEIWVAQKLLYASHYLQASLRVARLVEAVGEDGEPASYLIYLQQLMFDGRVGGVKRAFLTNSLRRNMRGRMQAMREDLEATGSGLLLTSNRGGR